MTPRRKLLEAPPADTLKGIRDRAILATLYHGNHWEELCGYVEKLPGADKEGERLYSTHSLRATTATLLLDTGVDIRKVQELLGCCHVTMSVQRKFTTSRRRTMRESASHDVSIQRLAESAVYKAKSAVKKHSEWKESPRSASTDC